MSCWSVYDPPTVRPTSGSFCALVDEIDEPQLAQKASLSLQGAPQW
jgi:hypothetical protein